MKKVRMAILLLMLVMMMSCAQTQTAGDPKPGGVIVDVKEWTATVKSVDFAKRTIVLEGPDGKTALFNAKNVRNLDQVKVGDQVKVEYVEELAIFVRKSNEPPSAMEGAAVGLAPKGQMPGGFVVDTVQITANVEAIDYQNRTITLKGPQGNVKTFKVDQSIQRFDQIKQGDQVVVSYTEALLITVVRP
jgi:hypothetical protein